MHKGAHSHTFSSSKGHHATAYLTPGEVHRPCQNATKMVPACESSNAVSHESVAGLKSQLMAGLQPSASSATKGKCCLIRNLQLCTTPKLCTEPTKAAAYWFRVLRPWTDSAWRFVVHCLPSSLGRKRASQRRFCCWCGALQTASSVRDKEQLGTETWISPALCPQLSSGEVMNLDTSGILSH